MPYIWTTEEKPTDSPLIEKSFIDGYEYMVLSIRGEHYCAYVGVPSTHWIYGQEVDRWWDSEHYGERDYPNCGEITYSGEFYFAGDKLVVTDSKLWYLGWAYINYMSRTIPSREQYMEDIKECAKWLKRIEREEEFVDWKNDSLVIL
tara:strand:+ start:232 stop:672 length:441 start_codon:yes stop_codon:yes gene_type:complete